MPPKSSPVIAQRPAWTGFGAEWYYRASRDDTATYWELLAPGALAEADARATAAERFNVTAAKVSVVPWPVAPNVWHAARAM